MEDLWVKSGHGELGDTDGNFFPVATLIMYLTFGLGVHSDGGFTVLQAIGSCVRYRGNGLLDLLIEYGMHSRTPCILGHSNSETTGANLLKTSLNIFGEECI